ncbi:MAG: alpha/beta hydrolase [Bacteroidota bacterium]
MRLTKQIIWGIIFTTVLFFDCQRESESPSVIEGTVVSTDGIRISYQVQGGGEPALVFVHCWSCDRSYWNEQLNHLARRHKVVAIDLAGHGESGLGRESWTMAAFGGDVVAVVEKLDLDPVVLIGHSMGGPVILEAARRIPDRVIGLVGVDTFQDFEAKYTDEQREEFFAPMRINFTEATRQFVRNFMFTENTDSALVEKIVADMSAAPPEVGIGALEAVFQYDYELALQRLRAPIRCINSDKYPTNVEANRRHSDSFAVVLMPGVGHFVMMEDPETFNRLLEENVNELVRTASSSE